MPLAEISNVKVETVGNECVNTFQGLLAKLEEEHDREVSVLRNEIAYLRTGSSGDAVAGEDSQASVQDDPVPGERASVRPTHRDPSLKKKVSLLTPEFEEDMSEGLNSQHLLCSLEVLPVASSESGEGRSSGFTRPHSSRASLETQVDAHVHPLWEAQDVFLKSWSSTFEKVVKEKSVVAMQKCHSTKSSVLTEQVTLLNRYMCCGYLPLNPSSKFKMCWDMTALLALSYDIVFFPMQVFDIPDGEFTVIGIADRMCIFFWTLDLPLNFLVGFYTSQGQVVVSFARIARRYVTGWFFLDLLIIGVDWFMLSMQWAGHDDDAAGDGAGLARFGKIMRVARSFRTLRLLRLMKLRELFTYIYEIIDSEWVSLIIGTLINLITLIIVNHGIACLWFWLGTTESSGVTWVKYYGYSNANWEDQYVASIHWSLTQFTPASTTVLATNRGERAFSVLVLLFAIVAFSSFLSGITSAMTRLRTINSYHLNQAILLNKFLRQNKISRGLSARLTRYVQLMNAEQESFVDASKVEYLSLLSGPLNVELQKERFMRVLKPHPFFHECSLLYQSTAMHHLCFTGLSSFHLARQDVLFDWGVECEKMYFSISGWLFYKRLVGFKDTPRYAVLGKTSWFCENALWTPWMHHGIMKALIEVVVIILNVPKFHDTARAYPEVFNLGVSAACVFVEAMNNPTPQRPFTWDVPWEIMYPDSQIEENNPFPDTLGKSQNEVVAAFHREAELLDHEYQNAEIRSSTYSVYSGTSDG